MRRRLISATAGLLLALGAALPAAAAPPLPDPLPSVTCTVDGDIATISIDDQIIEEIDLSTLPPGQRARLGALCAKLTG